MTWVWDARTFECLEVIRGAADVAAIARGSIAFPWRTLARDQETVVERADTAQPVAKFPDFLYFVATRPNGRTWAGAIANHLQIIQLEGLSDDRPRQPPTTSTINREGAEKSSNVESLEKRGFGDWPR